MKIFIETKALTTLLNILIADRNCPTNQVPKETCRDIISYYLNNRNERYQDYGAILKMIDKARCETPFHHLKEFIIYSINDLGQELFITSDDVYRKFCTMFHWRMIEKNLIRDYDTIIHIPSWFVGNMLLPVTLKKEEGKYIAEYTYENKIINIKNFFIPPDIPAEQNTNFGIFMASIVCPLDIHNFKMISRHLEEINMFRQFRKDVEAIDYSNFQRLGDCRKACEEKYRELMNYELGIRT